jgi:flagellar assembly factor FliW
MISDTAKFGKINYKKSEIIWMARGLLGFEGQQKYVIVSIENQEPFKWLQSLDDPSLAFLIIDPLLFKPDYVVDINPKDITLLGARGIKDLVVFTIVTIPKGQPYKMSANLQGPVIINKINMRAAQLVLGESNYDTQYFIFGDIERRLAQSPA